MARALLLKIVAVGAAVAVSGSVCAEASKAALRRDASRDSTSIGDSTGVLLAAGDIAACERAAYETARLLDTLPGQIIVVGDAAYPTGRDRNPYLTCYDTTWGRHKHRTRPVPGNHDVENGMRLYFDYFGAAAGPRPGGYYSYDVGGWHVLALNSNIAMGPRSPQGKWAAADLALHTRQCTLAYMHHPRFSSGPHDRQRRTVAMFQLLDDAGVDIVVSAHDHIYERFAPMRADGQRDDARGVRQFVVGTGGRTLYQFRRVHPHSESRQNETNGILKLTLHERGYAWEFLPAGPTTFRDTGTSSCH